MSESTCLILDDEAYMDASIWSVWLYMKSYAEDAAGPTGLAKDRQRLGGGRPGARGDSLLPMNRPLPTAQQTPMTCMTSPVISFESV